MVTITSNFGTEEEIKAGLQSSGLTVKTEDPAPETPTPATASPEQPANDGETAATPTPASGETAPPSEGGETKTQEPQAVAPKEEEKPSLGKFKARYAKLEEQISRIKDDLDLERGSKSKLQQQLEEAQTKLAALEKPVTPVADAGPVKPTRPTRASVDFDDDRYEQALNEYDQKMDTYNTAVLDKKLKDTLAAEEQRRQTEAFNAQQLREKAEFDERLIQTVAPIREEWDEVFEELAGKDVAWPGGDEGVVKVAIDKAQNPGELLLFFAKDLAYGDSKELARIGNLHPMLQAREIFRLEDRLVAERAAKTNPAPVVPAAAASPAAPTPEKVVPVKPKPAASAAPPITPVGSRSAGGATKTLAQIAEEDGLKGYLQARAAGRKN